jgi:hypothetical protein
VLREAYMHWTAESIAGTERDVTVPLLLLLHNSKKQNKPLELQSEFATSEMWKRKGVVRPVAALGRQDFRDWAKVVELVDRGNLDASAEKRQQLSGSAPALNMDGACWQSVDGAAICARKRLTECKLPCRQVWTSTRPSSRQLF